VKPSKRIKIFGGPRTKVSFVRANEGAPSWTYGQVRVPMEILYEDIEQVLDVCISPDQLKDIDRRLHVYLSQKLRDRTPAGGSGSSNRNKLSEKKNSFCRV